MSPGRFVVCAHFFFSSVFFFDCFLCAYSNEEKSSAKHANWLMKFLLGRTCGDRGNGHCGPIFVDWKPHRPWCRHFGVVKKHDRGRLYYNPFYRYCRFRYRYYQAERFITFENEQHATNTVSGKCTAKIQTKFEEETVYRRRGMKSVLSLKTKTPERFSFKFNFPNGYYNIHLSPGQLSTTLFSRYAYAPPLPERLYRNVQLSKNEKKVINYLYVLKDCRH